MMNGKFKVALEKIFSFLLEKVSSIIDLELNSVLSDNTLVHTLSLNSILSRAFDSFFLLSTDVLHS